MTDRERRAIWVQIIEAAKEVKRLNGGKDIRFVTVEQNGIGEEDKVMQSKYNYKERHHEEILERAKHYRDIKKQQKMEV